MPILQKAYRYRLLPSPAQETAFRQYAGARRFVWNWALARRKEHYAATGRNLSVTELCAELTLLKRQPQTAWLRECNAQSLQQAIRDLDKAFSAFFARRSRFPRFRFKKRDRPSFRLPQSLRLDNDRLIVPKLGPVRLVLHRPLEGVLKSATFKQDATGAWYVTLVAHFELPDTPLSPPDPERTVGVDLGLHDLAVLSNGTRFAAPRDYRGAERKLRRLQRHLARCQRGVAKTKLAKSVHDAAWAKLRFQLGYKACWQRKHLAVVGRFFPSSRLCPACGAINGDLSLSERIWTCACGATHDRDVNAAQNIRHEGLRLLLAGGTPESVNAPRELVSPVTGGQGSTTGEAPPHGAG